MKKHTKMDYNKITKYIWIGTNQCCVLHFKKELLKKGIKADISLEKEKIDKPEGVGYFLWLPVKDKTAPKLNQLRVGVKILSVCVKLRLPVFVHCKNGHGRAPTLVAAYFISRGLTVKKAIAKIKKKRPEIHLEKSQISLLKKFQKLKI